MVGSHYKQSYTIPTFCVKLTVNLHENNYDGRKSKDFFQKHSQFDNHE